MEREKRRYPFVRINNEEEIANHKHYFLDYEHHLVDLKNLKIVDNIASKLQPVCTEEGVFTKEELDWIYGFAFSRCNTVRNNDNGTIFVSGNLQGVYEKFKDKINYLIPGADQSPVIGGNYFITPTQYGLHNDSTRENDWKDSLKFMAIDGNIRKYVPWRNIIIPIFTGPVDIESHAIFFKQRHIDYAHVYHHGVNPNKKIATTYPIVKDYSTIKFHLLGNLMQEGEKNLVPYDKEHHEKYLYYTPYKRLTGLEVESTVMWKPGCPIVFDAFQLHATNKGFANRMWDLKMGLLLTFLRKVDV